MLGSLRFRLPALFLLGIVLAGLVASLIAIRFFQSYTRARAVDELARSRSGSSQLYARQAGGRDAYRVASSSGALGGDRIFWVAGVPGRDAAPGPCRAPGEAPSTSTIARGAAPATIEITRAGTRKYLAVARPLRLGDRARSARSSSRSRSRSCAAAR